MRIFYMIVDVMMEIIDVIIAALVAAIILVTIATVFFRYVIQQPIGWSEELSLAGFAWFTFLGAGSAIRKKTVVSLDFFYDMFNRPLKKTVKLITTVICIAAYLMVIWLGFQMSLKGMLSTTPYLKVSYFYIYLSIPIGGVFSILALLANLMDVLTGRDVVEDKPAGKGT